MKWTTHELVKLERLNNEINETIDLTEYTLDTDIIRISPVEITGDFEVYEGNEFSFMLSIKCTLILPCAITLEEVEYPLEIEVEEVFTSKQNDDSHIIDGITIDLLPIIWSNIILEKPMRVVSKNAYEKVDFENEEFEIDEDTNAFSKLKNYEQ